MSQAAIQRPQNQMVGVLHQCKICGKTDFRYPWNPSGCPLCGARMNPVIEPHWSGPLFLVYGGGKVGASLYTTSSGCPRDCMNMCRRIDGDPCPGWS